MILITGAAGFIGSALIWALNQDSVDNIVAVDDFHSEKKWKNLQKRNFADWIAKDDLFKWMEVNYPNIETVVHLGANTNTEERNVDFLLKNNFEYSKRLFNICNEKNIQFIYASSAATYGNGEMGYNEDTINLKPINPYGWSKYLFDRYILNQPVNTNWTGFKFFNVYGPNEYHKKRMASMIYHIFNQVKYDDAVKLYKSYKEEFKDGEQKRDFIYIKDVVNIIKFFIQTKTPNGIYNVGTGAPRTFNDIAMITLDVLKVKKPVKYIDIPGNLINQYQYFTKANIEKLNKTNYNYIMYNLESGIKDYIENYLNTASPYL
jgi:ADP-L-glycero-D-manno-heptose 6-epimerase